jgi:type IV pilus assembly protein PilO
MIAGVRELMFVGVLAGIPVASYFAVFKPQNAQIESAKQEIEHKKALLAKLREATAQSDDLAAANAQVKESIAAIEAKLPTTKEMDNILRQVAAIAEKNRLKIPNFKKEEKALPAGLAMEQPIDVEITGNFDGFYAFLLELEQLPRITRLQDVAIARNGDVDGEMKARLTLSIYYQAEAQTTP